MDVDPRGWRFAIVGTGRLGGALRSALQARGIGVAACSGRDLASAQAVVEGADCVVMAVPDRVIAELTASLNWSPSSSVVHASGALGLDVLQSAAAQGATVGCWHPLQSLSGSSDADSFVGIVCGVEGAGDLGVGLEALCEVLGARAMRLEGVDRARYHAAAVFVSNYVVALHSAAERIWTEAGLPAELCRAAMAPLTRGAADNVAEHPLAEALTGPVARGDAATVRRHLEAIDDPALRGLYRGLGAALLQLPLALSDAQRDELTTLFSA